MKWTQSESAKIWTQFVDSIFYADNHYTTQLIKRIVHLLVSYSMNYTKKIDISIQKRIGWDNV